MLIRMLRSAPCNITYAGCDYRVEPVVDEEQNTSHISAQLLTAAGRLWQPRHEEALTKDFPDKNGAEEAWTTGFQTKKEFFLQRALVSRLIDEGDAVEIEAMAPIPEVAAADTPIDVPLPV